MVGLYKLAKVAAGERKEAVIGEGLQLLARLDADGKLTDDQKGWTQSFLDFAQPGAGNRPAPRNRAGSAGRPLAIASPSHHLYIRAIEARAVWPAFCIQAPMNLRNIAIIAHVDHGKTTLVDRLLQQSGAFRDNQRVAERAMDSNDLERERGITILAKVTSILWHGTRINIVDTPGHADFGGEVERILNMVDGALVLVDAAEGPLPQTKFVVSKALKMGLKPIVVINKVDRADARPQEVVNEVFDLFAALEATDEQLDFPILYGSAKEGWMAASAEGPKNLGMQLLFDLVLKHVAPPKVQDGPFRLLGTILEANPYLGRIVTGRITSGSIAPNQPVKVLDHNGKLVEQGRVSKVLAFRGLERVGLDEASAGDIVSLAGLPDATVAHTICAPEVDDAAPRPADRPADFVDDLPGQRFAAGRHRGHQGHRPHDPRPAAARGRRQRRACASPNRQSAIPWKSPAAASSSSAS